MRKNNRTLWPSETEWTGMFCQRLVCQGEGYTLTFMSTHTHCHLSIAPSLALAAAVCRSRSPTKLAGVQHRGLSPRRLGRGPGSSCELFLGMDLGSTSPPLLLSRTASSSPSWPPHLPYPPLWGPVADEPVLQLSASSIVFNTHTSVELGLCKLACGSA